MNSKTLVLIALAITATALLAVVFTDVNTLKRRSHRTNGSVSTGPTNGDADKVDAGKVDAGSGEAGAT
eukprot:CAMPEP_0117063920 /NCGR_PEP_ID=MMETSP0472-20121206/44624_1 /TAXON_ID=693140 ORGANISM="Tiarina fusus, Strain LIS" /NCGR_SAMPLE_ID=MMETSP0472 /ASSEMBLY_ACC=CAM_ASM_000603 /LENGTH=67 /DNA_ID=CAMNT_0004783819 /DNA_START=45 /DNA_END=248 /DNA_ORIENTATION=-